jgi:hypothetical protein
MILQIVGLGNLLIGITAVGASDAVDADSKNGKFDFWYQ